MNDIGVIHLGGKRGGFTLVDADVFEELNQHGWTRTIHGYAMRRLKNSESRSRKLIYLHQQINQTPPKLYTDHINGNKLDNRRCNLRTVTQGQNCANRMKGANTSSRFKGVTWNKAEEKWQSQVQQDGKNHGFGLFDSETDAALAYNNAATKLFGEFARLNQI